MAFSTRPNEKPLWQITLNVAQFSSYFLYFYFGPFIIASLFPYNYSFRKVRKTYNDY